MLSPSFEYVIFPDGKSDSISEEQINLGYFMKEGYNLLFQADNLLVLKSLKDLLMKIDLIYIDPPYFAGSDEIIDVDLNSALNTESTIETKQFTTLKKVAYTNQKPPNDSLDVLKYCGLLSESQNGGFSNSIKSFGFIKRIWDNVPDTAKNFCDWFYHRVRLMKDILSKRGMIVVRFDYHYGHYAKLVLDTVFGSGHFIGEFMVRRMEKNVSDKSRGKQNQLNVANDSLFIYFNEEMRRLEKYPEKRKNLVENERKNQELYNFSQNWLDPKNNVWMDIAGYEKRKKTFYPTENSVELLERVIDCFSNEGDFVADFFAGSGVTLSVASAKNRKWIGTDIGAIAIIQIIQRLRTQGAKKFVWITIQSQPNKKTERETNNISPIINHYQLITRETMRFLNGKEASIITNPDSSIIDYHLFQDKSNQLIYSISDRIDNEQPRAHIILPDLTIIQKEDYIQLKSYKIRDTRFSNLDFERIPKFEYLIEYIMILTPRGHKKWVCKASEFGKILTTKKKREAPDWKFHLTEDMYIDVNIKENRVVKGIVLEICDITGLRFKVLFSGGKDHEFQE